MFCPICEKEFQPNGRQKYCSTTCREVVAREQRVAFRKRLQKESRESTTNTCKQCGAEYTPYYYDSDRQQFCSNDCKVEHHKLRYLEDKRRSTIIEPRDCLYCCQSFTPDYTPNHERQVYCSNTCKVEYHKEQSRLRAEEIRKNTVKQCPICDCEFTPEKTLKQLYCSEKCRKTIGRRIYSMMQRYRDSLGIDKSSKSQKLLGYSPKDLLEHLQTFTEWYQLKNQSWHLDHKIPIIAFMRNGITDPVIICNLSNLQPLAGGDNCSKNDTFDQAAFEQYMEQFV